MYVVGVGDHLPIIKRNETKVHLQNKHQVNNDKPSANCVFVFNLMFAYIIHVNAMFS